MRKFLSVLLTLSIVLSAAACGKDTESSLAPSDPSPSVTETLGLPAVKQEAQSAPAAAEDGTGAREPIKWLVEPQFTVSAEAEPTPDPVPQPEPEPAPESEPTPAPEVVFVSQVTQVTPDPAPEPEPESQPEPESKPAVKPTQTVSYTYIGNLNSKIFHQSNCGSVTNMKEKNKFPFATRDDAIAAGYKPCKNCTP